MLRLLKRSVGVTRLNDYALWGEISNQLVGNFATQILMMFAFLEYTAFSVFGCMITILLNVFMLGSNPDRAPYLVFSIYSLICSVRGAYSVSKIYKSQNSKKENSEGEKI